MLLKNHIAVEHSILRQTLAAADIQSGQAGPGPVAIPPSFKHGLARTIATTRAALDANILFREEAIVYFEQLCMRKQLKAL